MLFKLANQVLDVADDIGFETLRKLADINPKINVMTAAEREKLADDDFALSVITKRAMKLNKFPISDHDSTWLSSQYFDRTHYRLPKEAAAVAAYHIKQACERFHIEPTPAVTTLAKEASTNIYVEPDLPSTSRVLRETPAADTTNFAEIEKVANNYTYAQYAFPDTAAITLGNQYFEKFASRMPLELRHKYACALQKRAGECGVTLKGLISKYASNAYSADVGAHLASRRSLLQIADPKYMTALDKLAAMKDTLQPQEFARVLHGFDKRASLDRHYGGYLTDPYQATLTFGTQTKIAAGPLTPDSIQTLITDKMPKVQEYFGHTMAEHLKKEGEHAFTALPQEYQEVLAGIADGTA